MPKIYHRTKLKKGGTYDNDVDDIRTIEKPEYIQIQTSKMLLRQLKPFTKTWEQPGDGPNNFKVKPKLNKKLNIRFGKEALELADWILIGPDRFIDLRLN